MSYCASGQRAIPYLVLLAKLHRLKEPDKFTRELDMWEKWKEYTSKSWIWRCRCDT